MFSNICDNLQNCASFSGGRMQPANVLKKNLDGRYFGMN
jgi:hypothetical protein